MSKTQNPTLELAQKYIGKGMAVIPVPLKAKAPKIKGWQNLKITAEQAPEYFIDQSNIAALLGYSSGGLIDIDLDSPRAAELAAEYLPATGAVFGRESKRHSHWLYVCKNMPEGKLRKAFQNQDGVQVELRGGKHVTVLPGSVHPSGELIKWEVSGEPSEIDYSELADCVAALAKACGCKIAAKDSNNVFEKAREFILQMEPAIAREIPGGGGGDAQTFRVACEIFRWGLAEEDARKILNEYNETKCNPKWTDEQLEHKLVCAKRQVMDDGQFGERCGKKTINVLNTYRAAQNFVSENFTDSNGDMLIRWCAGDFLIWQQGSYQRQEPDYVRQQVYDWLGTQRDENGKPINQTPGKVTSILDGLHSVCLLGEKTHSPSWLDGRGETSNLVVCSNGILDTGNDQFSEHTPKLFNRNNLPVVYDPQAKSPENWLRFLRSIWQDEDAIALLQQWFGYCLTSDTSQQKALLLVGPKRSGKGTICNVITALLGADSVASPLLGDIGTNFGLSDLIGKQLITVRDARIGGHTNTENVVERLLSLTGQDTVRIDRKFQNPVNVNLTTRIMLCSNELPQLKDGSGALASRFLILPMQNSFYGHEDIDLLSKLTSELPGILNWGLEGLRKLKLVGKFRQTEAGVSAQEELRDLGSQVGAFLKDECEIDQASEIIKSELYERFKKWCEDQNSQYVPDMRRFFRDLKACQPSISEYRTRKVDRARVLKGIRLADGGIPDFPT